MGVHMSAAPRWPVVGFVLFFEQLNEFFSHCTGKLRNIGNGDGILIAARHIVTDVNGNQFDASYLRFRKRPDGSAIQGSYC